MTKTQSNIDLAKDSIPKLFINYFIPMLLTMLAMASYSTVDGIFVNKKLGDEAMKAIAATWPIFPILMACSLMFSLGGASLIGYYLAKGKKEFARTIFSSIFYVLFPLSFVLGMFFYYNADIIVHYFIKGLSTHVEIMAIEYLKGIFIGLFGVIIHPVLDICVVNDKRPRFAMFAMFLGAICNIIFNYLFLFVWEFGIIGSAYATTLGHIIGSLVLLWHYISTDMRKAFFGFFSQSLLCFMSKKCSFLLQKKGDLYFVRAISFKAILRVMKLGVPYASSEASVGFVMWLYNSVLKDVGGENSLAIYSALMYAGFNFFTILLALAESIQPLASFNYGMKDFSRLKKILKFYICVEIILAISIYIIFFLFDTFIASLFLKDLSLKAQSAEAMKIYFLGFIILGINIIIALYLQSLQRAFSSFLIIMSYTLIFIAIFLPVIAYRYGLNGAWIAYPIAQICALCVSIFILRYEIRIGLYNNKRK
ncbi:hypothetical protein CQA53_06365 [Helicobacter didelphidarum]|uniref:MATE family efflux transporter n=1 Tax=Helicobacter didelphidarum TaxID=2040648 RepID=A0A3D8IL86_9HELI|nr:MATE family efflux transporter [Helicobacter didelphidarum]RDU65394.1 hypothetical protein CQA53_06365 [Helicobacter didelphidarum]